MYSDLQSAGAELVAISPELPKYSASVIKRHGLSFDVLSDPGNEFARKLGLVFELTPEVREIYLGFGIDLPRFNGDDSWTLPLPGRIVVGADGVVQEVSVDPDYTVRPEPTETLSVVQGLSAS